MLLHYSRRSSPYHNARGVDLDREQNVRERSFKKSRVRVDDVCLLSRDSSSFTLRELHDARVAERHLRKSTETKSDSQKSDIASATQRWNCFRPDVRNLFHDLSEEGLKVFLKLLKERIIQAGGELSSSDVSILLGRSCTAPGLPTPALQNVYYEQTAKGSATVRIVDQGTRSMQRIVPWHSFYGSSYPRQDAVLI